MCSLLKFCKVLARELGPSIESDENHNGIGLCIINVSILLLKLPELRLEIKVCDSEALS